MPWKWEVLPTPVPRGGFDRSICQSDLGTVCVHLESGKMNALGGRGLAHGTPAYLLQCGDSYGEWRRITLWTRLPRPVEQEGTAWILHVSSLAISNLWHLLHVLTPALADRRACKDQECEILIDGLMMDREWTEGLSASDALRPDLGQSFAWPFLQLLARRTPMLIGEQIIGQPAERCFRHAYWGYKGVTLFGRDKGGLSTSSSRLAVDRVAAGFSTMGVSISAWSPTSRTSQDHAGHWRMLLIERRPPARRALVNSNQVIALLRSGLLRRRATAFWADFAHEDLKSDVRGQWQLASSANILIGAHGAGLAWGAFMPVGSVIIELMPHMQILHQQLCRVQPGETMAWDATPMYAYGGLSTLFGLHHACLIGLPTSPEAARSSLGSELGAWRSDRKSVV